MLNHAIPLLTDANSETPILWTRQQRPISRRAFSSQVNQLHRQLPDHRYVINLCGNRGNFLLAFAATLAKGQTNLLPGNAAAGNIQALREDYPDSYLLTDHADWIKTDDDHLIATDWELDLSNHEGNSDTAEITIPSDHAAAIAFTSGSTGKPKPQPKSWRSLAGLAIKERNRLLANKPSVNIVATVPAQHMYGLETTICMALRTQAAIHEGHPLFPADVIQALESVPAPRMLITTPVHIRTLIRSGLQLPVTQEIISATAPLSQELAREAESKFQTTVQEIYGCTEAGSIATRRTTNGEYWHPYPGMRVWQAGGQTLCEGDHLSGRIPLEDEIECLADGRFRLLGRQADMLNVAGKRASLAGLTHLLLSIPGVVDGVVFLPAEGQEQEVQRPAALVVAPNIDSDSIIKALREKIDAAFLPRPLRIVQALPRNSTGKLLRQDVLDLLQTSAQA